MSAASIILYVIAFLQIMSVPTYIWSIGKPRKPVTPSLAAQFVMVSLAGAAIISLIAAGVIR